MAFNYLKKSKPLAPNYTPDIPKQLFDTLGKGVNASFQLHNGSYVLINGVEKLRQDIYMVLSTPVGRRMWQPDFGSMLPRLLFQPYDEMLKHEIIQATQVALDTWLPQIVVNRVEIDESLIQYNAVGIDLFLSVRGTKSNTTTKFVLVLDEGTKIPPEVFTVYGKPIFKGI